MLLPPFGGLQMAQSFSHSPVLVDTVVSVLASVPDGVLFDATVGGGGHAAALLAARPGLRLVGVDRDASALEAARRRLEPFGDRVHLVHAPFSSIAEVAPDQLAAALFDLGVSSPQLDLAERGFSYRADAPIDMRMDTSTGTTAAQLVNELDQHELAALFRDSGESRFAARIARAVVAARPLTTTGELADVVADAIPAAARRRGHPARRVFQALRIAVNDELGELGRALPVAIERLAVGGRCIVISYHSGEDRLVKGLFASAASGGCTCPPGLPCVCGAVARHTLAFRGSRQATADEVASNPRADAARLRAIERTSL
ncbi:MAG TPA: 16S rRNA (cytosine(1402)-N(4))-methyltransferase RsmH [Acidimicrobiales bacterium]|nr:16S rRNA (cytosine(1402)-N(4))-methyltransferase RsmH [Acidimicrobiales bacterium]